LPLKNWYLRIHALLEVGRRIKWINCYFEAAIHHIGDHLLQQSAAGLQTGVRIHFDQVHFEVVVKHKVEAEYLKLVVLHAPCGRNYLVRGSEGVCHDLLDLSEDVLSEVDAPVGVVPVQVRLVLSKGQLVAWFKPAVFLWLLLHGVVCQMD
jgi:hypothetical protein